MRESYTAMVGNINKRNVSRVESTEYTLGVNTAERVFANEVGWSAYSLIIAVVLFFLSAVVSASSPAPLGYQWQSCRAVECSFLVPDGWRFEHLENGDVLKYQMTKNRQDRVVTPKVRISILRDSEARTGISIERHLQLFTSDLKRTAKVLETWNSKSGVLTSRAATSIHYAKVDQPVKQFSLLIANGLTGTLYVFSFEALPEVWDREWAIVEQVFAHLRLDEKI